MEHIQTYTPKERRQIVRVACGAGFAGDRPAAALKLLENVPVIDYLILECLAERTLAGRYQAMARGEPGFDPRIDLWMSLLLPVALQKNTVIITNMGVADPEGARAATLRIAQDMGLLVSVAVVREPFFGKDKIENFEGTSTYLGARPIVEALEMYKPQVVLTSRVADAALFLAPMIYELGWDWEDYDLLAAGALAGHLLECGCQLTGGYFASPGDGHRSLSIEDLLASSLPFADVTSSGSVVLGKADGSGGELSVATCTQQLIYEIGDPRAYITPDVVVDMRNVHFTQCRLDRVQVEGACAAADTPVPDTLLRLIPMDAGWKAWGEISYGGCDCEERAKISEAMVLAWMESGFPGSGSLILSYIIGRSSLWYPADNARCHPLTEARLRFDGLFPTREQADALCAEVEALYTNGPAGGGGIRTGVSSEIALQKSLVPKKDVHWVTSAMSSKLPADPGSSSAAKVASRAPPAAVNFASPSFQLPPPALPAKRGVELFLYQVAHGRAGDKGNRINISIIPFSPDDLSSLRSVLTPDWVQRVVSRLPSYLRPGLPLSRERAMESQKSYQASPLPASSQTPELRPAVSQVETSKKVQAQRRLSKPCQVEVYELVGVSALNIVVDDILDGGVTMSRHLDRHGKTLADLLLNEVVILP